MENKNVLVCGSGMMGSQIAMVCALAGHKVKLYDVIPDQLAKAKTHLETLLFKKVEKGSIDRESVDKAFSNLQLITKLEDLDSVEVTIEAIVEDLNVKKNLFAELSKAVPRDSILATNSSSIVSSKFINEVVNPSRMCNIHFFNPALVMELVEVVAGEHTSEKTVAKAVEFVESLSKVAVTLRKEIFGFIANRIISAIFDEAIWLYENGYADFADIDIAVKKGLGHPLGPFELLDLTGIDVNVNIKNLKASETLNPDDGPAKSLLKLLDEGKLGKKTGAGFYKYGESK